MNSSSFSTDFDAANMLKPSSSQMFGPIDIRLPPHKDSRLEHRVRLAPERMCFGTVRPQTAAYLICIAALHEITFGTILVFASDYGEKENWYQSAQWLVILTCRLLQYPSCFISLFGIRNNNPALIVPFMLSQVSLGSYADLHTYIQLVSKCSPSAAMPTTSPIILIVIPILVYAGVLMFFIYNMYMIVKCFTVIRGGGGTHNTDRSINEDLFL
ncbi:unnamed protein product [Caenorhabditis sp. 36 PRJEB53466]|nr:unnamed protein product [Caenorhabditis sp. 36 PRJEB53466]